MNKKYINIIIVIVYQMVIAIGCSPNKYAIENAEKAVDNILLDNYSKFKDLSSDDLQKDEKYLKEQFDECKSFLKDCKYENEYKSEVLPDPIYKEKSMVKIRIYFDCDTSSFSSKDPAYIQFFYDLSGNKTKFYNLSLNKTGAELIPQAPSGLK